MIQKSRDKNHRTPSMDMMDLHICRYQTEVSNRGNSTSSIISSTKEKTWAFRPFQKDILDAKYI